MHAQHCSANRSLLLAFAEWLWIGFQIVNYSNAKDTSRSSLLILNLAGQAQDRESNASRQIPDVLQPGLLRELCGCDRVVSRTYPRPQTNYVCSVCKRQRTRLEVGSKFEGTIQMIGVERFCSATRLLTQRPSGGR